MKRSPLRRKTALKRSRKPIVSRRTSWSPEVQQAILERDGQRCMECREQVDPGISPHHIKFRSQGGKNILTNGVTLCHSCHAKIHNAGGDDLRRLWEKRAVYRYGEKFWR